MIALKRILVASDLSEPSENALKYGKALAEAFSASLHILHVLDDPLVYGWTAEGYIASLKNVHAQMEKEATERLHKLLRDEERQEYRAEMNIKWGRPFVEIIRYAREKDINLIVMGTHGRGAIAHMLLGSVAEKVVRKAPCPVLSVRHPEHEFVMP